MDRAPERGIHALALEARWLFEKRFGRTPIADARAPGRVNLIGEHTDYNGGLVLPAALALHTEVALRFRADARVLGASREEGPSEAALDADPRHTWLDYARGVARLLAEAGRIPRAGFEIAVASEVPVGAGLSSSAALEVAAALALMAAAGAPLRKDERGELARLCQRAEQEFAGVPCGIMDPYVVLHAQVGHAILLRCSDLHAEQVPIPGTLGILIVDTGVRHALRDGGYAARRQECEQALAAARLALPRELENLSDVEPRDLAALRPALHDVPFRRLRHVVSENARVRAFASALRARDERAAGELLYASHTSLRDDFEVSCPESDALVEDSQTVEGCLGARMTGGGFGGSTLHLLRADAAEELAARLSERFRSRFGRTPRHWKTRPAPGAE